MLNKMKQFFMKIELIYLAFKILLNEWYLIIFKKPVCVTKYLIYFKDGSYRHRYWPYLTEKDNLIENIELAKYVHSEGECCKKVRI